MIFSGLKKIDQKGAAKGKKNISNICEQRYIVSALFTATSVQCVQHHILVPNIVEELRLIQHRTSVSSSYLLVNGLTSWRMTFFNESYSGRIFISARFDQVQMVIRSISITWRAVWDSLIMHEDGNVLCIVFLKVMKFNITQLIMILYTSYCASFYACTTSIFKEERADHDWCGKSITHDDFYLSSTILWRTHVVSSLNATIIRINSPI